MQRSGHSSTPKISSDGSNGVRRVMALVNRLEDRVESEAGENRCDLKDIQLGQVM